jgi:hypothetical protein
MTGLYVVHDFIKSDRIPNVLIALIMSYLWVYDEPVVWLGKFSLGHRCSIRDCYQADFFEIQNEKSMWYCDKEEGLYVSGDRAIVMFDKHDFNVCLNGEIIKPWLITDFSCTNPLKKILPDTLNLPERITRFCVHYEYYWVSNQYAYKYQKINHLLTHFHTCANSSSK